MGKNWFDAGKDPTRNYVTFENAIKLKSNR